MSLPFSMRVIVLACAMLSVSVSTSFAATSTGAVLIPGILNEYQPAVPPPVVPKPVTQPKPVSPTPVVTPSYTPAPTANAVPKVRTLSRGMRGTDVLAIQQQLISLSFLPNDSATGYFGPLTESAIKNFQIKNNIVSAGSPSTTGFGAVGPRTRGVISSGRAVANATQQSATNISTPVLVQNTPAPTSNTQDPVFAPLLPAQTSAVVIAPPVTPSASQQSCVFNSQTVAPGVGVFAYQESLVPYGNACLYEMRVCSDGKLTGSFPYSTCSQSAPPTTAWVPNDPTGGTTSVTDSVSAPASCVWNGTTVASGNAVTAYQTSSIASGSQCVTESRQCVNGSLTGTFQFASCSVDAPAACTFNGQSIASGGSVTAYQSASVASGNICQGQTRVCTNGALSGTYQFAACTVSSSTVTPPASCAFNGSTVASGGSVTAFQSDTVPYGTSCVGQQRQCINGTLSGSYAFATCQAAAPAACSFNGSSVGNGVGVTAYQSATVPFGQSCASQIRNCSNGTLSGSYQYSSCSVSSGSSCTLNGQAIPNGASVAAFQSDVVGNGGSCSSQTRTCVNGTLSGNSAYAYDRCAVQSNNASLPNLYVPTTYNGVTVQLHAWYAVPSGNGPYPVIILAHGCNGLNPDGTSDWTHQNSWASLFRQWGYATLIVDSFTARGYPNGVCSNGSAVNGLDHALDMYSAATVLTKTQNINPQKIGVFGSSHGGNAAEITATANRASTQAAFNALNTAGGRIGALASLYPICDPIGSYSYYAPLFVAAASDDNWDSPAVCKTLTNYPTVSNTPVDLNNYGAAVRMIVYKNATHAFDVPGSTSVTTDSSGHTFAYSPTATADLQTRLRTFFDALIR